MPRDNGEFPSKFTRWTTFEKVIKTLSLVLNELYGDKIKDICLVPDKISLGVIRLYVENQKGDQLYIGFFSVDDETAWITSHKLKFDARISVDKGFREEGHYRDKVYINAYKRIKAVYKNEVV